MRATWKSAARRSAALVCAALLGAPGVAAAQDAPFVDVTSSLPPLPGAYTPSVEPDCPGGEPACVDTVIAEMERRFEPLARACDHNAVFALSYLRTTEEYRRTIQGVAPYGPAFWDDARFLTHEDAVFARYYFDAADRWASGDHGAVPRAWRIAFAAADRHEVQGIGDLLLGINAHVQRDLPYALAGIGLVKPDGSSRKPDHDRVNQFLNRILDDIVSEAARRFDPAIDDWDVPGTTLDALAVFQLLPTWREIAWRNAERLAGARTAEERARVAAQIEDYAATAAETIRAGARYQPLLGQSSSPRDAYCAARRG